LSRESQDSASTTRTAKLKKLYLDLFVLFKGYFYCLAKNMAIKNGGPNDVILLRYAVLE
jgi:hypothetical protein